MERSVMRDLLARTGVASGAILGVAAVVLAVALGPTVRTLMLAVVALVFLAVPLVGGAAVRARSGGAVGWILLAAGVALPLAICAYVYSAAAFERNLPGADLAAWLDGWPWVPGAVLVPTIGLLLVPDGRLPSRRWRPVAWLAVLTAAALTAWTLFAPGFLDYPQLHNPTALPGAAGQVASALGAAIVLVAPLSTLAALSLRQRRRAARGTPAERALGLVEGGAWLAAAGWWACFVITPLTGDSVNATVAEAGGMLALAVTAWLAIRRYGLLDVRPVIGRALLYSGLTGCVLLAYLAVAGGIGAVAGWTPWSGAVAVTVAVLLALPLRDRLQRLVNRLLYGDRDDPQAAVRRLAQRLGDAADAGHALTAAAQVTRDALRLPYVGVGVGDEVVASSGQPVPGRRTSVPLVFAGETIGNLLVDTGPERVLGPAEQRLLADVAGQVAAAAHAEGLMADLVHSRERLVAATEDERRRLRRDLHDGLGPALAGVVLGLHRARGRVLADKRDGAERLLAEVADQVQDAVADVRRLVYGLRPPALDELGLLGALDEQARRLGGVVVSGNVNGDLPAAVEVAAYRIALEAMTNASRHAGARECRVTLSVDGALHLDVEDDGMGLPEQYRAGVGIASMRERASELGGVLRVEPRRPRGTAVRAVIPVRTS